MSAGLERRYRATLDWYPSVWREANADAMLGTLLDEAEATGRQKPAVGQTFNLLAFALLERSRSALPASVRDRASALAWGLGAALSALMFIAIEWAPWSVNENHGVPWGAEFGPFMSATVVLYALWGVGFVVAVAGAGTVARWLVAATIPTSVALIVFDSQPWAVLRPSATALLFLAIAALFAMQGSPAASKRGREWLLICAIGATALVVPIVFGLSFRIGGNTWWPPREIWGETTRPLPYVGALAVVAVAAALAGRYAWTAAALFVSVPAWLAVAAILVAGGGAFALFCGITTAVTLVFVVRRSGVRIVVQRRE